MGERSQEWHGHRLCVLPPGESWLTVPGGGDVATEVPEAPPAAVPTERAHFLAPARAPHTSWWSIAFLGVLGIAALITIFVAGGSDKVKEPAPLPQAPGTIITSLTPEPATPIRLKVGEFLQLRLPADRTYSTVVEQSSTTSFVVEDLNLPGQQPQLRADNSGHATVEVMSQPVCTTGGSCPQGRTLVGTLDVTVTRERDQPSSGSATITVGSAATGRTGRLEKSRDAPGSTVASELTRL